MISSVALNFLQSRRPILYAQKAVDFDPDPIQQRFLNATEPEIILNWSRQSGKSSCSALKAAHYARYHPDSLVLVVSATLRQAGVVQRKITAFLRQDARSWRKVRDVDVVEDDPDLGTRIVRCSVLSLELSNDAEVVSVPSSPDTLRGYSPDLIFVDEASRVRDAVMDAIRPMRASKPVQFVLASTPAGRRGFFYREWTSKDTGWLRIAMDARQCPRITEEFLAREKLKMSSLAQFEQEYYLRFTGLAGALLTHEQILRMFQVDDYDLALGEQWQRSKDVFTEAGGVERDGTLERLKRRHTN